MLTMPEEKVKAYIDGIAAGEPKDPPTFRSIQERINRLGHLKQFLEIEDGAMGADCIVYCVMKACELMELERALINNMEEDLKHHAHY